MENLLSSSIGMSKQVHCSKCSAQITLFDFPKTEYFVCQSCHYYFHFYTTDEIRTNKRLDKPQFSPVLKLGSLGIIHDVEFKVIAYLEKKEQGNEYSWREYILISKEKGYATLAEFDGHWSFIAGENFFEDFKTPISYGISVGYKNVEYKLFNAYTPIVTAMLGELEWNIFEDRIKATEFIAPPFMIVKEESTKPKQTNYYLGEYLDQSEIARAFNIDFKTLPEQTGLGAIQPSKHYERWISSANISAIALVAVLLIFLAFSFFKPPKEVINDDFMIVYDGKESLDSFKSFVTPSFNIDDASTNIEFEIATAVDNNWFETNIILVNEADNRTWEVSKAIEYYHGYEDGESWTEGSTKETIMLSNIPKGKYHLNVYPSSGDVNRNNLYIKATTNVSMWGNTLTIILLLCIYPIICWYIMRYFEKKRWENSDYSPFINGN